MVLTTPDYKYVEHTHDRLQLGNSATFNQCRGKLIMSQQYDALVVTLHVDSGEGAFNLFRVDMCSPDF